MKQRDSIMVEIEPIRRRLLLRVSLGLGMLWFGLYAFGLLPALDQLTFSLDSISDWWVVIQWTILTPVSMIILFVLLEQSRSWPRFGLRLLGVVVTLLAGFVAAESIVNFLIYGYFSPLNVFVFKLTIQVLFAFEAWCVMVLVAIVVKLGLERLESEVAIAELRKKTREASLREAFIRTQPTCLVAWLRDIAAMIPSRQDDASSELVEMGDYLRGLLRHTRRSTSTVKDELDAWATLARDASIQIEVHDEAGSIPVPSGLLIALFERIEGCCPSSRVFLDGEPVLSVGIETPDAASCDRVEREVGRRYELDTSRESETILRCEFPREEEGMDASARTGGSVILTRVDRQGNWAVGAVVGMGVMCGLFSTAQILLAGWMGRKSGALEFSMAPLLELGEWTLWGIVGGLAMLAVLRRSDRSEWMGGLALLTWLILPHLAWALVIDHVLAVRDYLTSLRLTFEQWDFGLRSGFVIVGVAIFRYLREVGDAIDERQELETIQSEFRQTRLRMIRAQLQPHFLLNTLHAVNAMIAEDTARAAELAGRVADLLEETSRHVQSGYLPLGEEVEMARRYLDVLRMRYEDRLEYSIDWDERLANIEVPALTTQPLLENAMVHGVEGTLAKTRIELKIEEIGTRLAITVTNPVHRGTDAPVKSGLGLTNTEQTLRLCYGDEYRFDVSGREGSFVVRMEIPKVRRAA